MNLPWSEGSEKHRSILEMMGSVSFPEFKAERVYMQPFYQDEGLPSHLARWQDTVDQMLEGVWTDGPIYLMVDQALVPAGQTHRRPGVHIDGYWNPGVGYMSVGHAPVPPQHRPTPSPAPGHRAIPGFREPEAILLASNVAAARAFIGTFSGVIGPGGDCSEVDVRGLKPVVMQQGKAYAGNVTCLHESLPVPYECERTLVRLNVPGWTP